METAGLTDLLKQEGSYTIFAPTDDAFNGLSKEDLALLKSKWTHIHIQKKGERERKHST